MVACDPILLFLNEIISKEFRSLSFKYIYIPLYTFVHILQVIPIWALVHDLSSHNKM